MFDDGLKVQFWPVMKVTGFPVNGQADFARKVTCLISRNGDLIHRMYLRVELDDVVIPVAEASTVSGFRWVDWIGEVLVKNVEIEIGGQRINNIGPEKYSASMVSCAA